MWFKQYSDYPIDHPLILEQVERHLEVIQKELSCPRCNKSFKRLKKAQAAFGPLLGHDPDIV